jgi:NAD(P)-dependent dehydrogenase (short-subunit alcohol dehydrogenase family)
VKTILVAGGAGGVGEGIVRALLRAGYTAIVPSRSEAKLALLRTRTEPDRRGPGRLATLIGHIGEIEGAAALRDRIRTEFGRIDVAIASLGGWWEGQRLIDVEPEVWDAVMDEMLRTHFVFARVFIPALQQQGGGRYIGIGGGAAYFPVPSSSLVSIAAAAQLMFTRALHAENDDPNLDILELVADGPVRTRDSEPIAQPDWITAEDVGRIAADLVATGRTTDPATETTGPIVRLRPTR